MGFIQAFKGALSGTFADQWKDFYQPRPGFTATSGLFSAAPNGQNNGIGENTKGQENIISNGSKLIVPEGCALLTFQDGAITGFIAEPGGYEFRSDDPNSQSIFAGDGIVSPLIKNTWERVKFGGMATSQQLAFYVNLKEIAGLKFGTPETIYWNDSFLDTKAGGMARGTYSIKIVDPLLFVKGFVPALYYGPNAPVYDFADLDNENANQLFDEFISDLSSGISRFSQKAKEQNMDTMDFIQGNMSLFAQEMDTEVENIHHWSTERGLKICNVNILINYDQATQELLEEIRKDDKEIRRAKRMGQAYGDNMAGMMAAASGQALQNAASNENGAMMGFMGMNMASMAGGNLMGAVQQPVQQAQPAPAPAAPAEASGTDKLIEMKKLLDAGAITQEDYDKVKAQILGL